MSASAGCSLSMNNHPDTCDSLHVTNLASDGVSRAVIFFSRYSLLDIPHLFSGTPLLRSRDSCMYINFNELLWNYENLIIRPFYEIFTMKIWSYTVLLHYQC